ncbi:MAG: helix-turn-helix domain-containing protein [Ruminiclostridium sp.]
MICVETLKQIRLIKNLSQQDIADRIGCSNNYISMLENRSQTFGKEMYEKWLHALYYDTKPEKSEKREKPEKKTSKNSKKES